ncbi:MAG: hypothetical protein BroJett038_20660 [Chloroflexota bacterium]|jgi:hypothetical protein|nr:MAG: hypothetical protein BroJett038_20660 [Chloroflexota bacterium]
MIEIPKHVWIETQDEEFDACDVIVEMESGKIYTAAFVTIPYLQRQMQLGYLMGKQMTDVPPVRYAMMETPHIVVEDLSRDAIEDTIDNLLALDTFESLFTLVTEDESAARTTTGGKRATTEVAAVVLSDVLVVEG